MKKLYVPVLLYLCLMLSSAQAADKSFPGREPEVERNQQRLELLAMWKMMDVVNLDKATAEKIFDIRSKYIKERRELQRAINENFRLLRQKMHEASTPDSELGLILDDIRNKRKSFGLLQDRQYEEISQLLTVRQRAELVLFLKDFQKDIRAFQRHGGGGGEGKHRRMFDGRQGPGNDRDSDE